MILISHRGNIDGPLPIMENQPSYIDVAISKGYDVEIDVWYVKETLYLGHDKPEYVVDFRWFEDRISKLWIHCKNIESIIFFQNTEHNFNYFWHENDKFTLTSRKVIWAYPTKNFGPKTIGVLPELFQSQINDCIGVCSDYISNYKDSTQ